jgi:hypothetical protein
VRAAALFETIVPACPRAFTAIVARALGKNPADQPSPKPFFMADGRCVVSDAPWMSRRRGDGGRSASSGGFSLVAATIVAVREMRPRGRRTGLRRRAHRRRAARGCAAPRQPRATKNSRVRSGRPRGGTPSRRRPTAPSSSTTGSEDLARRFEALVADPGRAAWTARADRWLGLDAISSAPPEDAGAARRLRVDTARRRAEAALTDEAIARFWSALVDVRALLGDERLAEARAATERLARATDEERVPGSTARLGSVRTTIGEAAAGLAAVLDALPSTLARGGGSRCRGAVGEVRGTCGGPRAGATPRGRSKKRCRRRPSSRRCTAYRRRSGGVARGVARCFRARRRRRRGDAPRVATRRCGRGVADGPHALSVAGIAASSS